METNTDLAKLSFEDLTSKWHEARAALNAARRLGAGGTRDRAIASIYSDLKLLKEEYLGRLN